MKRVITAILIIFFMASASASPYRDSRFFGGEWYFSYGLSRDFWSETDVNVNQPALNNRFTFYNVAGTDAWGGSDSVFAPQYNIRIGRFIDAAHTWAIEFSLDHTKYTSVPNQIAYVAGVLNGQAVGSYRFLSPNDFTYLLHNGLNHYMINVVKRVPIVGEPNKTLSLAGLFKFGVGVLLPHSENRIFGNSNNVGPKAWGNYFGWSKGWWQFGGWTAGVEVGVRFVIYKPFYIELTDKEAYSSVMNIPVYQGRADHTLWMNEVIVSLGVST